MVEIPPGTIEDEIKISPEDKKNVPLLDNDDVVSDVVKIDGNINEAVTLCFWIPQAEVDDLDLVFVNEDENCLEVADSQLQEVKGETRTRNGVTEIYVCGETDHFTSFAVLFDGGDGDNRCLGSGGQQVDHLIYILSAVAFGAACLMSFLGALVLFRYRENQKSKWKHRQREIEEHIDQQRKTLADMKRRSIALLNQRLSENGELETATITDSATAISISVA